MIKTLLVHLDGSSIDRLKLDHARQLAAAFDAHVAGVLTSLLPTPAPAYVEGAYVAADVIAKVSAEAAAERDRAAAEAAARLGELGGTATLHRIDGDPPAVVAGTVALARTSDLFVALRPLSDQRPGHWADLVEAVLFNGGRGVYLVPDDVRPAPLRRILVAWNGSRESARALAEAMPFVIRAERLALALVDGEGEPGAGKITAAAEQLRRHGLAPEVLSIEMKGRPVGRSLLETAHAFGADLVVMGGYGRSRFREWILGGATRDMWRTADLPILAAH